MIQNNQRKVMQPASANNAFQFQLQHQPVQSQPQSSPSLNQQQIQRASNVMHSDGKTLIRSFTSSHTPSTSSVVPMSISQSPLRGILLLLESSSKRLAPLKNLLALHFRIAHSSAIPADIVRTAIPSIKIFVWSEISLMLARDRKRNAERLKTYLETGDTEIRPWVICVQEKQSLPLPLSMSNQASSQQPHRHVCQLEKMIFEHGLLQYVDYCCVRSWTDATNLIIKLQQLHTPESMNASKERARLAMEAPATRSSFKEDLKQLGGKQLLSETERNSIVDAYGSMLNLVHADVDQMSRWTTVTEEHAQALIDIFNRQRDTQHTDEHKVNMADC